MKKDQKVLDAMEKYNLSSYEKAQEFLDSISRFPKFSYLAPDLAEAGKQLDRPQYLLLEYRENRSLFATCKYEYSKEDLLFLSDIALDTNDKAWFDQLSTKLQLL